MSFLHMYIVDAEDKKSISLPNPEHIFRRIMFEFTIEGIYKSGYMRLSFDEPLNERLIEGINYIRAYCKRRNMFVSKIEFMNKRTNLSDFFKGNDCEIQSETVIIYKNDSDIDDSD